MNPDRGFEDGGGAARRIDRSSDPGAIPQPRFARRISVLLASFLVMVVATTPGRSEDRLLYEYRGGAIVITNTPSKVTRPLPGREASIGRAPSAVKLPPTRFDTLIDWAARKAGLSPRLVKAVTWAESGFNPMAVSSKGACGLMQLMPSTAAEYGVTDLFDPAENLQAGAMHLRRMLDQFGGDITLALAAYNAGAGAVRRSGGVPNYPETRRYVAKIENRLSPGSAVRMPSAGSRPARQREVASVDLIQVRRSADGTFILSN